MDDPDRIFVDRLGRRLWVGYPPHRRLLRVQLRKGASRTDLDHFQILLFRPAPDGAGLFS